MTDATKAALRRLTEAGEIQAALERIADLESALRDVTDSLDRMGDKADDRICPNVWREVNAERRIAAARAALASEPKPKPAPRLTDDDFLQIIFSCGSELQDRKALTYDSGPYEVSTLTAAGSRLCRAIEAKVRGE